MDKDREQIGKTYTMSGASFPRQPSSDHSLLPARESNEGTTSAKAAYEDASVPYIPVPENNSPSWQMAETPPTPRLAPATSRTVEMDGSIVLLGIILGAGLGALLAYFTNASPLSWAWIGAMVGGAITFVVYLLYPLLQAHGPEALWLPFLDHWPW